MIRSAAAMASRPIKMAAMASGAVVGALLLGRPGKLRRRLSRAWLLGQETRRPDRPGSPEADGGLAGRRGGLAREPARASEMLAAGRQH
jgi:hypothetical protein